MRITVTRSTPYAYNGENKLSDADMDADDKCFWLDQGIRTFRLLLTPHKGSWQDMNALRIAVLSAARSRLSRCPRRKAE
jgi:hypothetical protein